MIYIFLVFLVVSPVVLWLHSMDMAKAKKEGKIHLYGIYGYFGLPGRGKTMCMSWELNRLRKKYGDKIYICTNYCYNQEDFPFTSWKQLLKPYDKPLVVAWDEVQNEFNSRDFKNFPVSLMTQLTQVRKGNGIQILYTSQRWHFVDKNFRSLSFGCWDCRTWFGRFTFARRFSPDEYDDKCNQTSVDKKSRIKAGATIWFIQSEKLRSCYDSYKMLETAKSKEYMSRDELRSVSADD